MRLYCAKCEKAFPIRECDGGVTECPECGCEVAVPDEFPGPGAVIGDFLVEKLISRGGMGEVFAARQLSLDRPVALKVLRGEYTRDREYVDGLFREARAAAKINHPNIVQAYAAGEDDGVFYFAMELVRGETMKSVLKRMGVIPFTMAARVIRDVAAALDVAWREQKLVHQDIKPDNIMLTRRGEAKLADLGLAKTAAFSNTPGEDEDEVIGTPQYISPEQLYGQETDIRSDLYSLGATFYHLVTGRVPYTGKDGDEIARQHVEGTLKPPVEVVPAIGQELSHIICKMMEKNKENRYQSAAELVADLDRYLNGSSAAPAAAASEPQKITLGQSAASRNPKFGESRGVETFGASRTPGAKLGESRMEGSKLTPSAPAIQAAPQAETPAPKGPKFQPKQSAPLSIKEEKKEPEDESLKGPPILQKLEHDQKRKGEFKIPPLAWKIPLVVVVIVAAAAAIFISLVKTQTLPASAHGFEDKVLAAFGKAYDRREGKFIPLSQSQQQTAGQPAARPSSGAPAASTGHPVSTAPAAPAAPRTRPEYIRAANQLARAFKLEPQNEEKNLAAADAFFATFPEAVTAEEKKAAAAINRLMAAADEASRVAPFRDAARKRTLAQEEAARAAAARQEQAAQATLEALAEKTTEAAQKTADVAEESAQADEAIRNSLKWRIDPYLKKTEADKDQLVLAFVQSVTTGKDAAWKQASRLAAGAPNELPYDAQKDELTAAQSYRDLGKKLGDVYETAHAIGAFLTSPEEMKYLLLQKPGSSNIFYCDHIQGAVLYGKDPDGKELTLDLNDPELRALLTKRLDRKFKTAGSSFVVALVGGEIGALTADGMEYPSDAIKEAAQEIAERYLRARDAAPKE